MLTVKVDSTASSSEAIVDEGASVNNPQERVYIGFGGWLYVFIVIQVYSMYTIITSIGEWVNLLISYDIQQIRDNGHEDWANLLLILGLVGFLYTALLVILILVSWFFALRTSRFYKHTNIIYSVVNLVGVAICVSIMIVLNYQTGETLYAQQTAYGLLIGAILFAGMWIPYFIKSQRVANTFIR